MLFFLPVLGLVYALRSFARQKELTESLERFSLQMAAEHDHGPRPQGQLHRAAFGRRSSVLVGLADEFGSEAKDRSLAHLAGLLHDLGKISVPDKILNSRERLGDDEWDVVRGHSVAGQKILSNMSEFEGIGLIVLHHHERFDGGGYPHGLSATRSP